MRGMDKGSSKLKQVDLKELVMKKEKTINQTVETDEWLLDNTEFDYEVLDTIFLSEDNQWTETEYMDYKDYDDWDGKDW